MLNKPVNNRISKNKLKPQSLALTVIKFSFLIFRNKFSNFHALVQGHLRPLQKEDYLSPPYSPFPSSVASLSTLEPFHHPSVYSISFEVLSLNCKKRLEVSNIVSTSTIYNYLKMFRLVRNCFYFINF